jgi:hypothetical protein
VDANSSVAGVMGMDPLVELYGSFGEERPLRRCSSESMTADSS